MSEQQTTKQVLRRPLAIGGAPREVDEVGVVVNPDVLHCLGVGLPRRWVAGNHGVTNEETCDWLLATARGRRLLPQLCRPTLGGRAELSPSLGEARHSVHAPIIQPTPNVPVAH